MLLPLTTAMLSPDHTSSCVSPALLQGVALLGHFTCEQHLGLSLQCAVGPGCTSWKGPPCSRTPAMSCCLPAGT